MNAFDYSHRAWLETVAPTDKALVPAVIAERITLNAAHPFLRPWEHLSDDERDQLLRAHKARIAA